MSGLQELDTALRSDLRAHLEAYAAALPVRRVVVVGNAPLPPSEERAALIDGADLVVRCNSFVLDDPGDAPCLGSRTHVVVMARATRPTAWSFQDYPSRAYLVVDVGNTRKPAPPALPSGWPDDLGAWPVSNRLFGIPLKVLMRPERAGIGAVPTTGTLSAYLAHELFPEAQLYLTGFSFLTDVEQTHWEHHAGNVVPVHRAHKLDREAAILNSWIADGTAISLP